MERTYNKLVRDNIPDIIISNEETPVTRILNDEEHKKALEEKLYEEYQEVLSQKIFLSYLFDQQIMPPHASSSYRPGHAGTTGC